MLGGRSSEQWIAQYATSHTHPVNRFCHSLGIPLIVVSLAVGVAAIFYHPLWMLAAGLFVFGWLLQFIATLLNINRRSSSRTGASFL